MTSEVTQTHGTLAQAHTKTLGKHACTHAHLKTHLCNTHTYIHARTHHVCSRFLQGKDTDPKTVDAIREAVRQQKELTVRILNYTKSGRPFWNMFTLAPMSGGW